MDNSQKEFEDFIKYYDLPVDKNINGNYNDNKVCLLWKTWQHAISYEQEKHDQWD